jgi:hypothetical protein
MATSPLPRSLTLLGIAGWAPQVLCLVVAQGFAPYHAAALGAGCLYAAIILSFLGGLWWMSGLRAGAGTAWILGIAVVPSLFAWAAVLPLVFGAGWPAPSAVALGLGLLASPLADRAISRQVPVPPGWLGLRTTLSTGLGLLTLAIAAA